jgi:hypothetical protein
MRKENAMKTAWRSILVLTVLLVVAGVFLALPAPAAASPLPHEETGLGGLTLANWKAALTTLLLVVGLFQFLGQAVVRGWIKVSIKNKKRLATLHRLGGIVAFTLTLTILVLCLYVMYGPNGGGLDMLYNARVILHAVFGGLLMLVLVVKAIISNFARKQLRVNVPLGITAGVLTLGVFVMSVIPHVFRFW